MGMSVLRFYANGFSANLLRKGKDATGYGVRGGLLSESSAANSIWSSKWFFAAGGSTFCRPNGVPQFAEVHFVEQMAFRS